MSNLTVEQFTDVTNYLHAYDPTDENGLATEIINSDEFLATLALAKSEREGSETARNFVKDALQVIAVATLYLNTGHEDDAVALLMDLVFSPAQKWAPKD